MSYELRATNEIVPRDYVLVRNDHNRKTNMSPTKYIIGKALITDPTDLKTQLKDAQAYKREEQEKQSYEQMFPWQEEELRDPNLFQTVREGVKSREGRYILVSVDSRQAIPEMNIKRWDTVVSKVKSKSPRKDTVPTRYNTSTSGVWLDREGRIAVRDMTCGCSDYGWGGVKGSVTKTECMHLAGQHQDLFDRVKYPDEDRPVKGYDPAEHGGQEPYMAFAFMLNWFKDGDGNRDYHSRARAALEMDVLVHRYLYKKGYFDMDLRLLRNPLHHIYMDCVLKGVNDRSITREVVRQDVKREKLGKVEAAAQDWLFKRTERELRKMKFRHTGYCLELDKPAYHYENDGNAVNLFYQDGNLLYSWRPNSARVAGKPDIRSVDRGESNAFAQLGREQQRFDDRSMLWTPFRVDTAQKLWVPGMATEPEINVPEVLTKKYEKALTEAGRGQ